VPVTLERSALHGHVAGFAHPMISWAGTARHPNDAARADPVARLSVDTAGTRGLIRASATSGPPVPACRCTCWRADGPAADVSSVLRAADRQSSVTRTGTQRSRAYSREASLPLSTRASRYYSRLPRHPTGVGESLPLGTGRRPQREGMNPESPQRTQPCKCAR
jgi:hypothetical protein